MRLERLEARVLELERENAELRDRLRGYENPKNSRNSSIPPSKDPNRPKENQSLRKVTGRKPGGQPGSKGSTLKMNPDPDHVVELRPDYCRACGSATGNLPSTMERARQIVDVPPIRPVWTEYRTNGRQCGLPDGGRLPQGRGLARKLRGRYRRAYRLSPSAAVPALRKDGGNDERRIQHRYQRGRHTLPVEPLRRKDGAFLRNDKAEGRRLESGRCRRDRGKGGRHQTLVLDLADRKVDLYRTFGHQGEGGHRCQFPPRVPRGDTGARRMEGAERDRRETPPDLPAPSVETSQLPERKIRRGAMGRGPQKTAP